QTYVPDYLNGDIFPTEGNINVTEWLAKHGESQTTPPLLVVINTLKSQGVRQMAATGYCFGGKLFQYHHPVKFETHSKACTQLASSKTTPLQLEMAHPSSLNIPTDFELSCASVQINRAELDPGFTPALAVETDAVLGDGQYAPGYLRRQFDGVGHGFAV
ncbi:hypothetical protein B0H14DRAFT_2304357, partial [Mycena olivaceomarginata]